MELGKYLSKGIWGFVDKSLPVIYGIGFIFLVVRTLSPDEYGTFVIFQSISLILFSLGYSFILQPLIKFSSETDEYNDYFLAALVLYSLFLVTGTLIIIIGAEFITKIMSFSINQSLYDIIYYLPFFIISAIPRNLILAIFQAKFEVKKYFWIDFFYFIVGLLIIFFYSLLFNLKTSDELVLIITASNLISSIVALLFFRKKNALKLVFKGDAFLKILKLGKYSLGSSINYSLHSQIDTFFVAYFSGVNGAALYGAIKIITRIYDIYAQVIQMFILPASSLLNSKKDSIKLTELLEKSTCFSLISIIPITLVLFLFSNSLIELLYSTKYNEAKFLLKLFSLTGIFVPWISVASSMLFGLGKTQILFKLTLINLLFDLVFYYIGGTIFNLIGIIYAILLIQFIMTLLWLKYTKYYVNFSVISVFGRIRDIKNFLLRKTGYLFHEQK